MGLTEIAQLLGVSKQRAAVLVERDTFPAPEVSPVRGRLWRRSDVERWIAKYRSK